MKTERFLTHVSLLRIGPVIVSYRYTQKSAGEERKGPLPNNVRESAFQRTNQAILSSANFYIFQAFLLYWWFAYDVIKNMTMQIKINLPLILV